MRVSRYTLIIRFLNGNKLNGAIPTTFSPLLENIYIGFNALTGMIPESIGDIPELQQLDLGGNYLTGELPLSVLDNTELNYLNVADNQLSGSVEFETTSAIEYLDISGNEFEGGITGSEFIMIFANGNSLSSFPQLFPDLYLL
jgi:Leucine-rich repeat (LRR) protein